ncbi:hypothetical protein KC19_10G159300 [Ceratodon purpureus]|uniref:Uncharacterized protein n=1 Tax=Ceratodon purpureus TaxID=3225 RepID=A0A8T0GMC9_CERPU|nr:hypothetical protein KC19_10G159300 [Ceratodon purpureus]
MAQVYLLLLYLLINANCHQLKIFRCINAYGSILVHLGSTISFHLFLRQNDLICEQNLALFCLALGNPAVLIFVAI